MKNRDLNARIISAGKELFRRIEDETPSVFNKDRWIGKVLDWCMTNEEFKTQMFRFVDVFPYLSSTDEITRHIQEYFGGEGREIPSVLKWGVKTTEFGGAIGASFLSKAIRHNLKDLAAQFIVGETTAEALENIVRIRKDGFAFVLDILGEATISEEEAEEYVSAYVELLDGLGAMQNRWKVLGHKDNTRDLDWGFSPKISISVKPTSLYSLTKLQDFEGSVTGILTRMQHIYDKVIELGGSLCIDMESYQFKDITLELFRRLRQQYRDYPYLGIALQSYLLDTDRDLDDLLAWSKQNQLPVSIRLVKGAYWDYETVRARQNGWASPVYTIKAESDAAFERHASKILENYRSAYLACASHNIRSICAVKETAKELGVPDERYEFQVLYGMAEPVRKGLLDVAGRVRLYCPYGEMVPGMGYLVRRLLENTANECFIRRTFAQEVPIDELLEDPKDVAKRVQSSQPVPKEEPISRPQGLSPFANEPLANFTDKGEREAYPQAIAQVRKALGRTYPLFINGRDVVTTGKIASVNPAQPSEIIGHVCSAGLVEAKAAIAVAKTAFAFWRDTAPRERAEYLIKAAVIARRRIHELAAWQILEIGKQWDQAQADVAEAIDFLEYYAREMVRLGTPRLAHSVPGEANEYFYEPRGVATVIAPWNFPLAISCGMVSAAIVTGNCVVYKPSTLTPVIGHHLVEIFREAGLPAGVFNFVPGPSSLIGDVLVEHPDISIIAFTGSMEVGLQIIEKGAKVHPGQVHVKRIVCEMGGKNAIIVDNDANLDEAIPLVLYSALGFQGQKCSACSRVIVLDAVYDHFVDRLVKAARSKTIGPAENPAYDIGPVADAEAQKKVLKYIEIGRTEGKVLYMSSVPDIGYYVPVTILGDITPEHRMAQEEVFGPVLAVMRVRDFQQALEWANSTRFALTGAVFSRSPQHLEDASRQFRVGNLYLNRHCTGAMVERQPFGGSRMSGAGTKAGGPDYLLHFMDPMVVSENTMRRGFIPAIADDNRPQD
ncbi:MAG: 1-pyrroline-5-carboxylate dehydrogenase 1 [Syntrophorhabdus sp. PtaU1.Bin153]|nr:MAG: 1-pyrroline-5-carboxylate dehydrogenase 1 [Syntrophorhabdus sp. PtaU1.Bin153]